MVIATSLFNHRYAIELLKEDEECHTMRERHRRE
jgi:hypothetical protein